MYQRQEGRGWVEVICGSMFSGKTEELLRRIRRAQIGNLVVQVFKPKTDTRFAVDQIGSHVGGRLNAIVVENAREILLKVYSGTRVVVIDEGQFFDEELPGVCDELADRGLRVIVAGLDRDFRGEPFGPMPAVMALAEILDKLTAICVVCGGPASRTQRLINGQPANYDDPVIMVGAEEVYEARCRHCHNVPRGGGLPEAIASG